MTETKRVSVRSRVTRAVVMTGIVTLMTSDDVVEEDGGELGEEHSDSDSDAEESDNG